MKKRKRSSLLLSKIKKLFKNKLAVCGLLVVLIIIIFAVFAPLITSFDPNAIDLKARTKPPGTSDHLLGTDKLGRDVFARILYGARISITIGLLSSVGGGALGIILGCIGGYIGSVVDKILLRLSELFSTFPSLILVLMLVAFIGQGTFNLIFIFTFTGWMGMYRLVRGRFLSLKEESFVESLQAFGVSKTSIMFKHLLPNALGPVIVSMTMTVAGYVLSEAGLSFLGLGVPSGIPTWGNILNAAKDLDVLSNYWWLWVSPGLAISLFVLGVNFFGDGLRDVFDPRQ